MDDYALPQATFSMIAYSVRKSTQNRQERPTRQGQTDRERRGKVPKIVRKDRPVITQNRQERLLSV